MKVVAVIPAYKEATRVGGTVLAVRRMVDEVVVVDDGSGDGTAEAAQAAGAIVLRHAMNRGQGAALRTGTDAALRLGADIVVHVDADGQHDPSFVPALVAPISTGTADVVFGSRFLGEAPQGMPFLRRVLLVGAKAFNTLLVGIPSGVTDPQSGMRAMTAAAAGGIAFRQDGMAHCSEILRLATRGGWRWVEVPIRVRYSAETLAKGQKATNAFRIAWKLLLGLFTK